MCLNVLINWLSETDKLITITAMPCLDEKTAFNSYGASLQPASQTHRVSTPDSGFRPRPVLRSVTLCLGVPGAVPVCTRCSNILRGPYSFSNDPLQSHPCLSLSGLRETQSNQLVSQQICVFPASSGNSYIFLHVTICSLTPPSHLISYDAPHYRRTELVLVPERSPEVRPPHTWLGLAGVMFPTVPRILPFRVR